MTREYDDVVIALLKRPMTPELKDEARNAIRGAYATADVARRLGHQPRVGSREHDEAVAYCLECGALRVRGRLRRGSRSGRRALLRPMLFLTTGPQSTLCREQRAL